MLVTLELAICHQMLNVGCIMILPQFFSEALISPQGYIDFATLFYIFYLLYIFLP